MNHTQEVHAKFFPPARPIVKADPETWKPKPPRKMIRRTFGNPSEVKPPPLPIENVLRVACTLFGITKAEMLGHRRDPMMIAARIYVSVRLSKEFGYSLNGIGRVLNRDHSSIFNLLAKIEGRPFGPDGKRRVRA